MLNLEEKLRQQYGATKQVRIWLCQVEIDSSSTVCAPTSFNKNATTTQKSTREEPSKLNFDEKMRQQYGITKQVKVLLRRVETNLDTTICGLRSCNKSVEPKEVNKNGFFVCSHPHCYYKCVVQSSLKMHMVKHSTERPYKCQQCNKTFKYTATLRRHLQVHNGAEKKFSCSFPGCSWKFQASSDLKKHFRTHTGEKPQMCSICGWKCSSTCSMKRHMRVHGVDTKKYYCKECDFVTKDSSYLKTHIQMKHLDATERTIKLYKCSQCEYSTFRQCSFIAHSYTHLNEKPYKCGFCNFNCTSSTSLNQHFRKHTSEKPHFCSKCDFEGSTKVQVDNHFNRHHQVPKYNCDLCPKAFYRKDGLKAHVISHTHTGTKKYACNFCEREYSFNSGRSIHQKACKKRPQ